MYLDRHVPMLEGVRVKAEGRGASVLAGRSNIRRPHSPRAGVRVKASVLAGRANIRRQAGSYVRVRGTKVPSKLRPRVRAGRYASELLGVSGNEKGLGWAGNFFVLRI